MLKKAIKVFGLVLILSASLGSFIYMNSANIKLDVNESIALEQSEFIPDDHTIVTPSVAIAKKVIILAKCFLYPSE